VVVVKVMLKLGRGMEGSGDRGGGAGAIALFGRGQEEPSNARTGRSRPWLSDEETEAQRGGSIIISHKRRLTFWPPSCFKCTKPGGCWMALRNETSTLELRFQNDQILRTRYSGTLRTPSFSQAKELA